MVKTKSGDDSKKHSKKNAGRGDDSNSSDDDAYVSKKQKLSGNQYSKKYNGKGKRSDSSGGSRSSSVEEVGSRKRGNMIGKRRGDDSDDSYGKGRGGSRKPREDDRGARQSYQYEAYVGSLSYNATEDDISSYFDECGKVSSVNMLKGRDGKPKGIAFVRFEDSDALNKALELNGKSMLGRNIVVEKSASRSQRDGESQGGSRTTGGDRGDRGSRDSSSTVYVGNLSFDTNSASLERFFKDCGEVTSARIISNEQGKSKGFGYVEFASADDVKNAIRKNGDELDGRDIKVDFANSKPSGGGGGGDRRSGGYGGGFGGGRGGRGGGRGGFRR